jgi:hypothetical protein
MISHVLIANFAEQAVNARITSYQVFDRPFLEYRCILRSFQAATCRKVGAATDWLLADPPSGKPLKASPALPETRSESGLEAALKDI